MYQVALGFLPLPIAPSKIVRTINGRNETMELLSGLEVNIIKPTGLSEFSFEFMIPHQSYPFASLAGQLSNLVGGVTGNLSHGLYETAIKEYLEYLKTGKSTLVSMATGLSNVTSLDDAESVIFAEKEATKGVPFQFIVVDIKNLLPNPICNMKVLLEDYEIIEDVESHGLDTLISVKLKEYVPYSTKILTNGGKITRTRSL